MPKGFYFSRAVKYQEQKEYVLPGRISSVAVLVGVLIPFSNAHTVLISLHGVSSSIARILVMSNVSCFLLAQDINRLSVSGSPSPYSHVGIDGIARTLYLCS